MTRVRKITRKIRRVRKQLSRACDSFGKLIYFRFNLRSRDRHSRKFLPRTRTRTHVCPERTLGFVMAEPASSWPVGRPRSFPERRALEVAEIALRERARSRNVCYVFLALTSTQQIILVRSTGITGRSSRITRNSNQKTLHSSETPVTIGVRLDRSTALVRRRRRCARDRRAAALAPSAGDQN